MGWVLVQGPGFGLRGPALIDPSDQAFQGVVSLAVQNTGKTSSTSQVVLETLIDASSNVGFVRQLLREELGLSAQFCCLSRSKPSRVEDKGGQEYVLPAAFMQPLDDQAQLSSLSASDHVLLHLVYTGDFAEDFNGTPSVSVDDEDNASDCSGNSDEERARKARHAEDTQPKFGGYHMNIIEPDDFENRLDFEGHSMEPVIIPQKLGSLHALSPRSSAFMQSRSSKGADMDSELAHLAQMSTHGWPNYPENSHRYYGMEAVQAVQDRQYAFPLSYGGGMPDLPEDFDDDEVQFGPSVDPHEMPDFGYGQEIEWIDAD
uniref:Uncharacterized protein n=1 Tax=Alexandrium catenella TaxID=2925 RepID=A0A7S1RDL0_ALECA